MPQFRLSPLQFPITNRRFIHTELLGHFGLEKPEVERALAEVIAYRNKLSRIGLW